MRTALSLLVSSFFTLFSITSAQAGSLFPPANIGRNANVECPDGTVLKWTGDSVVCADPSEGVSVTTCPAGQLLAGISKGRPICRQMSCRTVQNSGPPPSYFSVATCGDGEILTGGGAWTYANLPDIGAIHDSRPYGNSWVVDAYRNDNGGDMPTVSYAICCSFR
jgi:hypothetical protein